MIRTALRQAGLEVGDIRIDFPGPTIATLVEREGLAPDPAADGLGIEATGRSNLAEGLALGKAALDLLIAVHPGRVPGALLLLEPWRTPIPGQGPGRVATSEVLWVMAGPGAALPGDRRRVGVATGVSGGAGRRGRWLTGEHTA